MNLPELLKIAEAASEQAKTPQDQIKRSFTYGSSFTPDVAIELIKRLQEAEKYAARWRVAERMYCGFDFDYRMDEDSPGKPVLLLRLPEGVGAGAALHIAIDAAMNGGKDAS